MVEFLLKNGPPNIKSSFKYDIYKFRTFESHSQISDGVDRGDASNNLYNISSKESNTSCLATN